MKKLILALLLVGIVVAVVTKLRSSDESEADLWAEATKGADLA